MTTPDEPALDAIAAEQIDEIDIANLDRLASLYAKLDPVPSNLVERVAFGITLDALNAELAELERTPVLAGARADDATTNAVTFTSATLTVMVSITTLSSETARVDGWITPGGVRNVEARTPSGTVRAAADVDGRFVLENVPRGLVQFTFARPGDAQAVITPALEI